MNSRKNFSHRLRHFCKDRQYGYSLEVSNKKDHTENTFPKCVFHSLYKYELCCLVAFLLVQSSRNSNLNLSFKDGNTNQASARCQNALCDSFSSGQSQQSKQSFFVKVTQKLHLPGSLWISVSRIFPPLFEKLSSYMGIISHVCQTRK